MFNNLLKILITFTLFCAGNVFAVIQIELTQGVSNPIHLEISPFIGNEVLNSTNDKIEAIVNNDLKNSGRFLLFGGITPNDLNNINFDSLRSRKIEGVIAGKIKQLSSDEVSITFSLFDVYNKKKLFEKEYTVKKSQLRKFAHHISDIVYQQFTGSRGIFSTKIAYVLVKRIPGRTQYSLQVADSDGYNTKTLLTSGFPLMSPVWSNDGKKLAYVSFEGNRAAIYIQEIATGSRRILTKFPGINGAPAWSPDGRKMALVLTPTGYPKIYILDLATNNLERITDGWYLDTEPNWSPDGNSILFTSDRGGSPQIYRIYLSNKKIERVTHGGSYNARASFTPSGKSIIMLHQHGSMFSIAEEDLQSGRIAVLTPSGLNESPSIAPNGKMVVYATGNSGRGILAEVAIDGSVKILLPEANGEIQEPAWSPFLD